MQAYRLYLIGPDGKMAEPPKVVECQTDDAAITEAQKHLDRHAVEVWRGARMIAHLDPLQSSATS
jgi:hypothetical protein